MKTQLIKNQDTVTLATMFKRYGEETGYPWFLYYTSLTASSFEPVVIALQNAQKPTDEEIAVERDREELLKEYSEKDEKGNPIRTKTSLPNGAELLRYSLQDEDAYNQAFMSLLDTKYPGLDKRVREKSEAYTALLAESTEIEVYPFPYSIAPKNLISGNDMRLLLKYNIMEWDLKEASAASPLTLVEDRLD